MLRNSIVREDGVKEESEDWRLVFCMGVPRQILRIALWLLGFRYGCGLCQGRGRLW